MESTSKKAECILDELRLIIEEQECTISKQQSQIDDLLMKVDVLNRSCVELTEKLQNAESNKIDNQIVHKKHKRRSSSGKKKTSTSSSYQTNGPVEEVMRNSKLGRSGSGATDHSGSLPRKHLEEQDANLVGSGAYELSSDLRDRRVEALRSFYGGYLKSERAARVIQEAYRNYRLRNQFKKIRSSRVRRMTFDSIHVASVEKAKLQAPTGRRSKSFDQSSSDLEEISIPVPDRGLTTINDEHSDNARSPDSEKGPGASGGSSENAKSSDADCETPKAVVSNHDDIRGLSQDEIVNRILSTPATNLQCIRRKKKHGYETVVLTPEASTTTSDSTPTNTEPVVVRLRRPNKSNNVATSRQNSEGDFPKKRDSPMWLRTSSQLSLTSNENDPDLDSMRSSDSASLTSEVSSLVGGEFHPSYVRRSMLSVRSSLIIDSDVYRKRLYRIGLNLFNMKPRRGLNFLMEHRFVANTAPSVASFLLNRKGLSRQMVGEFLGNTQKVFNQEVLDSVCDLLEFSNMELDEALRSFQEQIKVQGEAQKVERLVEAFSQRYCTCNPKMVEGLQNPDSIFVLAFAIIMLNTDLHSPNMKHEKRMSEVDFIKNLRGVDNGDDLSEILLKNIYNRIKEKELITLDDHVTAVLQVENSIVGKKPVLAVPHRRLVCFVRMFQVVDPSKPQRHGVHQREVFLFNDLMLVMKILQKKKGAMTYTLKQSMSLHGMSYVVFESTNYPHGIRFINHIDNSVLINFNAPNEHDRKKFVTDVRECIAEVQQMESLRIEAELEKAQATSPTEAKGYNFLSTDSKKLSSSMQNLNENNFLSVAKNSDHQQRPISMYNLNNMNNNQVHTPLRSLLSLTKSPVRNSTSAVSTIGNFFAQSSGKRKNFRGSSKSNGPMSTMIAGDSLSSITYNSHDDIEI